MPPPELLPDTTPAQGGPRSDAGFAIRSPRASVMSGAETEASPESSPLWGLVLVLGEIAVRIEHCQTEEQPVLGEDAA